MPVIESSRWSSGLKARTTPILYEIPNSIKTCLTASEAANRLSPHNPWIPSRCPTYRAQVFQQATASMQAMSRDLEARDFAHSFWWAAFYLTGI